jgi:ABC-type transport system substrate-binding protein
VPPPPAYSKSPAQQALVDYHWSKTAPQTQVLGTPRRGGVLINPNPFGLQTLHPGDAEPSPTGQAPFCYTHNTLIGWDFSQKNNPDLLPWSTDYQSLAASFEVPDQTTVVLKLKPGITWHNKPPANGAALTIDDIKETYLNFFKSSKYFGSLITSLQSIDEPSPGQVRIKLSEPDVSAINFMRTPQLSVLNAKHIQAGTDALKTTAIGTGPFTQEKMVPNSIRVYKRNPNYWLKGPNGESLPFLDGIVSQVIADPAAALAAFRSGQLDAYRPVSIDEFNRLKTELNAWGQIGIGFCGCNSPSLNFSYRDATFKDVRVRQALSLAIDRQDIIDTVFGGGATPRGFVPWYYKGEFWEATLDQMGEFYKTDKMKATQMLSAAGVTTPLTVDYYFRGAIAPGTGATTGDPYLESVRRDLKAIGVELNLKPLDNVAANRVYLFEEWKGLYNKGAGRSLSLDAAGSYESVRTGGADNGGKLSDPKIDQMVQQAKAAYKQDDYFRIAKQINDYVVQNVSFGLHMPSNFALSMWRGYLHNVIENPAWWITGGGGQQFVYSWMDDKVPTRNIDSF